MTKVVIVGEIYNADLSIGGGPVMPPVFPAHPIAPGGPPPVAGWTPPGYHPAHPIAPGGPPPTVMPPIYYPPYPAHPIVLPPDGGGGAPPEGPPDTGGGGRWAYSPIYGWVWLPAGGGDKPNPPQQPPTESPPTVTHPIAPTPSGRKVP